MNFTYFKFLFINTIKRKPVWITWLLFLLTATSFLIIVPLATKMNTLQLWANTTMTICQTFLGMTCALFTSVLAINLFKDGNEEGTELIVVSKPISRFKIILTKFFVFFAFCLIVNISACLISSFTIFLPRTEPRFYWGLIVSMLIGNAISFGIFGSIAIILTVPFAKAGVIITNIVLSLVFLIYQALTLLVFRVPSRAMADKFVTSPSYIITHRDYNTGKYTEDHVVKFTAAPVQKKDHPCAATNWQEMKAFWEGDILTNNPTAVLNVTDLAGQVSLTYLSCGIDEYSARQAQRMFAISRFYNYQLTSPASPEIIDSTISGKKSMPWIYIGKTKLDLDETNSIYLPKSFGFEGIPPVTSTRLRGYTDLIPVGFVKSKEILSQREVYFEPAQWKQYKAAFEEMYEKIFDYNLYKDIIIAEGKTLPTDLTAYSSLFAFDNSTIGHYYELAWHCFKGDAGSVITAQHTKDLACKTVDDFNDRLIQFKYFAAVKAQQEQQTALNREYADDYEKDAKEAAKTDLATLAYVGNIKYPANSWYMQDDDPEGLIHTIEPGTQTISWDLIEASWANEKEAIAELTEAEQLEIALKSTKSVADKTSAIFDEICYPREYYMFDSVDQPRRNAKITGDTHVNKDYWCPYMLSLLSPFYKWREEVETTLPIPAACQPMGHNLQYFYYKTTPIIDYWKFAVIWSIISITMFTAGAIVYNKYDVK